MANDEDIESEKDWSLSEGTAPDSTAESRDAIRFVLDGNGSFVEADPVFAAVYGSVVQAGDRFDENRILPSKHVQSAIQAALDGASPERRFVLFPNAAEQEPVWIFEAIPFTAPHLAAGKGVAAVFVRCEVPSAHPSSHAGIVSATLDERLARERLGTARSVTATIRHEISNALTTIIGNAELLLRRSPAVDAPASDRIQEIVQQGRRIQRVIEKLDALTEVRTTKHYGGYEMLDLGRQADPKSEEPE